MKIRMSLVVEVDPERWRQEYGVEDVREDVKGYVLNMAQTELQRIGASVSLAK